MPGTQTLWNTSHGVDRADFLSNALDVRQVVVGVVGIHIWYALIWQTIVYRSARSPSTDEFSSHHHTTTQQLNQPTNQQSFPIFYHSIKTNTTSMKFSLAIAATMAAATMASPTWGKDWSEKWGEKWGNNKDQSTSSSHRSIIYRSEHHH